MNKLLILLLIIVVILATSMNTKVEGLRNYWYTEKNKDYSGNTIRSFTNMSYFQCLAKCLKEPNCAGITKTGIDNNNGTCWLKSKMDTGSTADNYVSTRVVRV